MELEGNKLNVSHDPSPLNRFRNFGNVVVLEINVRQVQVQNVRKDIEAAIHQC